MLKTKKIFLFLKAQAASLIATLADYILTICCVEFGNIHPVQATMSGNILGGIVNFWLGRNWVFAAKGESSFRQALKYLLVWLGNLLLNGLGMHFFAIILHVNYILSKLVVSLIVGGFYNYFFQKRYVFNKI